MSKIYNQSWRKTPRVRTWHSIWSIWNSVIWICSICWSQKSLKVGCKGCVLHSLGCYKLTKSKKNQLGYRIFRVKISSISSMPFNHLNPWNPCNIWVSRSTNDQMDSIHSTQIYKFVAMIEANTSIISTYPDCLLGLISSTCDSALNEEETK